MSHPAGADSLISAGALNDFKPDVKCLLIDLTILSIFLLDLGSLIIFRKLRLNKKNEKTCVTK